jgi:hypothetical protein
MTLSIYIQCFAVGLLGMVLQALLKIKSIQDKARKANVEFSTKEYILDDWVSHTASLVTLCMCLFFVDEFTNFYTKASDYLKIGFAFVGYTGSDIMSRIFSVVNKRINNAIDYKTTIADEATGTTDKPTPAK